RNAASNGGQGGAVTKHRDWRPDAVAPQLLDHPPRTPVLADNRIPGRKRPVADETPRPPPPAFAVSTGARPWNLDRSGAGAPHHLATGRGYQRHVRTGVGEPAKGPGEVALHPPCSVSLRHFGEKQQSGGRHRSSPRAHSRGGSSEARKPRIVGSQ